MTDDVDMTAMDALDRFYPDRMARRILGMGDVVSLDWARKLRASERTNRRLKSRLDQILSEH